jgi:hypothetical protein
VALERFQVSERHAPIAVQPDEAITAAYWAKLNDLDPKFGAVVQKQTFPGSVQPATPNAVQNFNNGRFSIRGRWHSEL